MVQPYSESARDSIEVGSAAEKILTTSTEGAGAMATGVVAGAVLGFISAFMAP